MCLPLHGTPLPYRPPPPRSPSTSQTVLRLSVSKLLDMPSSLGGLHLGTLYGNAAATADGGGGGAGGAGGMGGGLGGGLAIWLAPQAGAGQLQPAAWTRWRLILCCVALLCPACQPRPSTKPQAALTHVLACVDGVGCSVGACG